MKPLNMDALMDQEVQNLSGGELQRVALTMCLGQVRAGLLASSSGSAWVYWDVLVGCVMGRRCRMCSVCC